MKDWKKVVQNLIPADKPHVSNSLLSEVKRLLLHEAGFVGGERFLIVGKEVHRRVLEPDEPQEDELTIPEELQVTQMIERLMEENTVIEILNGSENELVEFVEIDGVRIKGIIDVLRMQESAGYDLKTTSTRSQKSFDKSVFKYDYIRQGVIYSKLMDLDSFVFFAITKKAPFKVFYFDINDYPEEVVRYEREIGILIDAIKAGGRFCDV